jgi:hypothetical protein
MSFLDLTPQQQTGLQVNSWINSLLSSVDSAKANYDNISNWLIVASENSEYSDEDFDAVAIKLTEAVDKIKSLLPKE